MPESSLPTFHDLFDQFEDQRQRQPSSSSSTTSFPYSRPFTNGQPLNDEPRPIDGPGSDSSPAETAHGRQRTTSSGRQQNGDSRQNSIPWKSTMITTAEQVNGGHGHAGQQLQQQESRLRYPAAGQQFSGDGPWSGNGGYDQFGFAAPAGQASTSSTPASFPPPASFPYDAFGTPGSGGYASTPMSMSATPSGMAGYEYQQGMGGAYGQEAEMAKGTNNFTDDGLFSQDAFQGGLGSTSGYSNGPSRQGSGSGEGNVKMEEFMEDLLQTLSRTVSREPSPQIQNDQFFLQQQQNSLQAFTPDAALQSHMPSHGSRPASPFEAAVNAPSPSFATASITRPGSSPAFQPNKIQSPPTLHMPNNASSPVTLPPIDTQQATSGGMQAQGHALANQMGGMGGLLPPTNPALQHLSGMMGISPIAPSADGPQIFVQPSTPISGLKDGRGHFDAALRRAAQQAQHAQQSRLQQNGVDSAQQQQFTVPSPNMGNNAPSPQPHHQSQQYQQNADDFAARMAMQAASGWGNLGNNLSQPQSRPRAKSDSFAPVAGGVSQADLERQAMAQIMAQARAMGLATSFGPVEEQQQQQQQQMQGAMRGGGDWRENVGAWLNSMGMGGQAPAYGGPGFDVGGQSPAPPGTVNPNQLPGNDQDEFLRQLEHQHQLSQLQAQRSQQLQALKSKMNPLSVNIDTSSSGIFKYEPGEFSPTSMAFYQQRGMLPPSNQFGFGTNSAPFFNTSFQHGQFQHGQEQYRPPPTAPLPSQTYLDALQGMSNGRRQSFNEGSGSGSSHHATGAGTPGYGMGLSGRGQEQGMSGRVRGVSPSGSHRRAAKSEDFGRGGWGLGHGGSTTEFLNSITANDGSLIPPIRGGRTHSRQSSVSSGRSASPALSISSHGSSMSRASVSGHGHMDMPDGVSIKDEAQSPGSASGSGRRQGSGKPRVSRMKVTSMATEVAATNRRTNNGIFQCPVPGCGSTFTRHFNLKGHMRSHNDERPYKCLYDGCPKGFARQHDCKRHMLLHKGLRPFECEGCHKKFARLDALTRHHKSEQGIECAIAFPLPTNPDGSALSESQYKSYKSAQGLSVPEASSGKKGKKRAGSFGSSAGGRSGDSDAGAGSGMDDYDRI